MKLAITLALVLGLFAGSAEGAAVPRLGAKCLPPEIPALESMILLHDRWLRAPLEGFRQEHLDTIPALQRTLAVRLDGAPGSPKSGIGDIYILFFVPAHDTSDDGFVLAAVNDRLTTGRYEPWIDEGVIDSLGHVRDVRTQACQWVRQDRSPRHPPESQSPDDGNDARI